MWWFRLILGRQAGALHLAQTHQEAGGLNNPRVRGLFLRVAGRLRTLQFLRGSNPDSGFNCRETKKMVSKAVSARTSVLQQPYEEAPILILQMRKAGSVMQAACPCSLFCKSPGCRNPEPLHQPPPYWLSTLVFSGKERISTNRESQPYVDNIVSVLPEGAWERVTCSQGWSPTSTGFVARNNLGVVILLLPPL